MRLLLLIALAASLLAAPAHAEPPLDRPLTGERYTASLEAAGEFWHAEPPCRVRFYAASDDELQAWLGFGVAAAVRAVQHGKECPVWIGPGREEASVRNRVEVCTITTHEVGHLLGNGHSTDPDSIMWPVLGRVTWPCWDRFVPPGSGEAWQDGFAGQWATRPDAP